MYVYIFTSVDVVKSYIYIYIYIIRNNFISLKIKTEFMRPAKFYHLRRKEEFIFHCIILYFLTFTSCKINFHHQLNKTSPLPEQILCSTFRLIQNWLYCLLSNYSNSKIIMCLYWKLPSLKFFILKLGILYLSHSCFFVIIIITIRFLCLSLLLIKPFSIGKYDQFKYQAKDKYFFFFVVSYVN